MRTRSLTPVLSSQPRPDEATRSGKKGASVLLSWPHLLPPISRPFPQPVMEATRALSTWPETKLIEQAQKGDHQATEELIHRYQDAVYNLCYRMLGDPHEAEDAAQEVFIKMYRHLHRYNADYRFSTWLLSIASHHCIDQLRKHNVSWVSLDAPGVSTVQPTTPHPESVVLDRERSDEMQHMLDKLSPQYRLVLVLHYWYDLSYHEIADILGTNEGTIKTRAHRARRRLGELLLQKGWST